MGWYRGGGSIGARRSGVAAGVSRSLALCAAAVILLVAAPAAGAATWNLQSVPAPQSPNAQGFSVSCSSATSCMAVGFVINPLGEQQPLSEVWNGTTWTAKPVPLPSGVPFGLLRGVSCTSATACTAVGGAGTSDFPSQPLAVRWNGTNWTLQTVPAPSGQFEPTFEGVSCNTGTSCTAVGSASDGTHSVALAEHWNGTNWAAQSIPNPAGAAQIRLDGIACSSGGGCITVGYYTSTSSNFFPDKVLAERWNGTSWAIQTTPLPAGTTDAGLTSVSCSAGNACTAVGGYSTTNSFPNKTLAERWNGAKWAIQTTPNPASGSPMFSSVSCPTATDCTAVGVPAAFGSTTLVEQWNGTTWTIQSTPSPGLSQNQLSGVSCTAATACTAVGGARAGLQVPPSMLVERWNGTNWSLQTAQKVPGALVSELKGVSCGGASSCSAVGDFITNTSRTEMLAEGWNGTRWAVQSVPNPSTTNGLLNAVSCSSATACTAVGSYANASSVLVTLAERWNGTRWTVQSTPNPASSTNATLQGVSCPSATSCAAVGKFFDSGTNHWVRLAERWDGTNWTVKTTQAASGETFSTLNAVSCASSTACVTVGGFSSATGAFQANKLLTEVWNGTSWTLKTPPNPTGTTFAIFTGVSCSAATACTAAGGFSTTPGDSFPRATLAERWNGTSWAIQTTTNPSTEGFNGDSCPAATFCSAVANPFAESWNGTKWSTDTLPFLSTGELELATVSCSAASTCTAAGRSVMNYLMVLLFSNSSFIDSMYVPLAVREP